MQIPQWYGLGRTVKPYDFTNIEAAINDYITYMMARTAQMFVYDGLPDTIDPAVLETYLQMNGHVAVIEHEGAVYTLCGGWGGEPNQYYIPTDYVIANPYLNLSRTFTNGEDCVIMRSDSLYKGLADLHRKYATMLATNDNSIMVANINSRIISLIEAPDDRTRASAEEYLKHISKGDLSVIAGNAFLDGVRTQPYATANSAGVIKTLVDLHQYIKGSWYTELGLRAQFQMKREAVNAAESAMNDNVLAPLVDDMLACRKADIEKVNAMFGLHITVDFNSVWFDNALETEIELGMMEADLEAIEVEAQEPSEVDSDE